MSTSKYEFKRNLAIIVGINEYSNGIPALKTPVNDARKLGEILHSIYKYDVQLLLDSQATLEGLNSLLAGLKEKTLPTLKETVQENDRVLFYFAGHGIVPADGLENKGDPLGYLVPQDARGDILLQEQVEISKVLLPMQALHDALAELPCRHMLVILDCCFAGAFRSSLYRDIVPARKVFKQRFDRFIKDRAWQALASAAHDQKAIDYLGCFGQRGNIGGHSPFAEALFEGLRGAADTTLREGDGIITATELYCYLRDKIEELTEDHHNRQTPGLFQLKKHDKGEYIFLLPDFNQEKLENAPALNPENNPYQGLKSYEEEDSQLFFGRDELVKQLYDRISKPNKPLTVVLGVSGSGKSSIVKAGLVPYLRANHAGQWHIIPTIRPGESPFTALAEAVLRTNHPTSTDKLDSINTLSDTLKQAPKQFINVVAQSQEVSADVKLLLVIDQFEELITICKQQEQEQFLHFLAEVVDAYPQQLGLVLTLRSDFEPRFLDSALKSHWTGARFPIRAMRSDELRQAIERPALEKMLDFDPPNLVDQLIDEVGQMPGALSLLSFTLSELYIKCIERESRTLSKTDYDALGGVAGSLTHRGTEEYNKLDEAQRVTMRRVMLRMVTIEGGESARRRVPLFELVYLNDSENKRVEEVIKRLSEARLIVGGRETAGEAYVEPAHDALVRGWKKLQEWKDKEQENLALQQRLIPAANDWSNGRGMLWIEEADRLAKLEKLLDTDNWLNKLETEFATRSIKERQDRIKKLEEDLRISEERRARAEVREKTIRVENLLQVQPLNALVLAIQAMGQNLDELSKEILAPVQMSLHTVMKAAKVAIPFQGHEHNVSTVAFSPDGQLIVTGSVDNTLRLWDIQGNPIGQPFRGHESYISSVAFSPNGQMIVSGSYDNTIRLWNIQGNTIGQSFYGHENYVSSVAFSSDGQMIVSGSYDNTIRLWDIQGNPIIKPFWGHEGGVKSVTFSPNQQIIISSGYDSNIRLWDIRGNPIGEPLRGHQSAVYSVACSPDGQVLASSSADETVRLWDIKGNPIGEPLRGHQGAVLSVAFSHDGQMIASNGADGTVKLWDIEGELIGELLRRARGVQGISRGSILSFGGEFEVPVEFETPIWMEEGFIYSVAFSPNGQMIVSGNEDNKAQLWDITSDLISKPLQGHEDAVWSVAVSPNGQMIASSSRDKTVRLWDIKGNSISKPLQENKSLHSVAFSPDSQVIASTGMVGSVYLWDVQGNLISKLLQEDNLLINAIGFDLDGNIIISNGSTEIVTVKPGMNVKVLKKVVGLWDIQGNLISKPVEINFGGLDKIAFSPNGQMIAIGRSEGTVQLWDMQGNIISETTQGHTDIISTIAFSPDGQILASGSRDQTVRLWDIQGNPIGEPLQGHEDSILSIAFSPNGQMLASGSQDGTVRLWDIQGNPISEPLEGHKNSVLSVAFSPNGQMIISGSADKTLRLWRVGWKAWLQVCCDRLRYHPIFKNPEKGSIEEAACETCKKYVWNQNEASAILHE